MTRTKRLSPALVLAMLALLVALSGTAVAASVVPLAKRALTADRAKVADTAKKLGTETAASLVAKAAQTPGPASSAAGLVSVKQVGGSLGPMAQREFTIACDGGCKVVSGGYASDGAVLQWDSRPISDTTWSMYLANEDSDGVSVTLYAVCVR